MTYAFAYRLPGTSLVHSGWSDHSLEQPQGSGFLISPFIPHSPMIFIPNEHHCDSDMLYRTFAENGPGTMFPFPEKSTAMAEHKAEIEEIIKLENEGELTKAVAARCLVSTGHVDVNAAFKALCDRYPDAFVFLFSTPESGTWIGATPELLLSNHDEEMKTMALAGTRPADSVGEWDDKNIKEQAVVTDYIKRCFGINGLNVRTTGPVTVQAGPVEHLRTEISALAPQTTDILPLLDALAPTPALCGMPRELAAETIARCENFQRGYYGGFCGPWHNPEDFGLYVILRCARVSPQATCLFAGGGIMPDSDHVSEWDETEAKLSTLSSIFNMNR